MSILSGFLKTRKYRKTVSGFKKQSEWTSSQTVVMGDGSDDTDTLENRFGKIKGATSSLASTSTEYVLTAKAGKDLQDKKAPKSHASTGTEFGVGTSNNYGHVKIVDSLTDNTYQDGCALSSHAGYELNTAINNLTNSAPQWFTSQTLCQVGYAGKAGWTMVFCTSAPTSTIPANTWSVLATLDIRYAPKYNIPFVGSYGSYTFIGYVYTNGNIVIYPTYEISTNGNAICFNVSYPCEYVLDWEDLIGDTKG